MIHPKLVLFFCVACPTLITGALAHAQGRGPGGPPPGQHGPGSPGGPPGPPGPGNNQPSHGDPGSGPGGTAPPRNGLQIGPAGRWWDDRNVTRAVGLSAVQQRKMDTIFDSNKPAILSTYKTLMQEQARLTALNKSAQPNQSAVFAQIDAVSQARAALQKATTQMLLQIRQEMAPEQVQKLEQIH